MSTPKYITRKQLKDDYGISEKTAANWASARTGPPFIKLGRGRSAKVLYSVVELEAWLEQHRVLTCDSLPIEQRKGLR